MQLIINTFGTGLRRKGDRFVIKRKDAERAVEISAHKVQSLVIATGVQLSSNVVQLAAENNIDIVFLDASGHPTARVWQTKMGSTAAIRRRQLEAAETEEAMRFVREWISQKIRNQLDFLRELEQRRPESKPAFATALATLQQCADKVSAVSGTVDEQRNTLLGLEGAAGRSYFTLLGQLVPQEYRFTGRSRQPATDPFNAMLNYAYGVLYSQVERALILAGLDPFVGFLHTDNYNKRSLVFDMIEPFRILADRTTVLIFTGRRAQREFFRQIPGGIELAPEGRAALMESFNKRLDRTVRYPVQRALHSPPPAAPPSFNPQPKAQASLCASEPSAPSSSCAPQPSAPPSFNPQPSAQASLCAPEPSAPSSLCAPQPAAQASSCDRDPVGIAAPAPEPTVPTPVAREKKEPPQKYRKIAQRAVIQHEAHALANALLGRRDLPRIVESAQLFADET